MTSPAAPIASSPREIRVFISSTFRDMQEEREELVKQIFPQLRRLCESRGVTWGEVDLRWGVPDEAKAEGKVLPLCLAEIEHCRPYFIGLLGERYGWVPEEIPEELIAAQPWLNEHRKQSVTALEILHGVLRNPEMAEHAFFYFRDPLYAAAHTGFTEEDTSKREELAKLKDDIRKSGFPVSENFATPKQLGEWVLRDLTAVIEDLYPERSIPDALDRAAADHEAYAASRRRVYIGREEYIERLDAHAAGDGPPLVVLGESGGGKSALLTNWTHRWREQHPETPVLVHFIGAAPDSANWMAMLRRLLGEFKRKFGIQIEIPDQPDALRMALANALHMVAAHGRVVLVLDALNQIEDRDGAPDLVWLPPVIPANVRLVVSTLPGRPLDDLRKREWPMLTVEPLTAPERETLIAKYLKRYAKELSAERRRRIAAAPQSGNGLYLSTLLNELRQFGRHEELDQRIGWYLEAANPFELYGKVIQRWEQDYGKPDPACENIVRESLARLWAARRGLSETELLESLGTAGSPLPRAVWSPLYLAAGDGLVNRGGLLTFAHDFLREAVREAYLPTASDQQGAHRTLAAYFLDQPQGSPRQLDELPWQLQEAAVWQSLAVLLADPGFFSSLWGKDEFEVKAYWAGIEAHSPLHMEQVYGSVIERPARDPDYARLIGVLLGNTGKPEAALRVRAHLVEHYREQGDRAHLQGALGNQAVTLNALGDLDGAMALHKEEERLCRELGNKDGLQRSLGNQAIILYSRGDLDGAMALHKEEELLCRELGNIVGLASTLGNEAPILYSRGDVDGAMALFKEEELLCRELGDKNELQRSLGNQAIILYSRGDLDGAMALHKEEERLCRDLGDKDGLQGSLGNQALILYSRGDLDGAMALHKEEERLCRELGNKNGLRTSLGSQALILYSRGDPDGAMALHKEEERLCRELGNKDGLQASMGGQAQILNARGDQDGAMALYKEAERLCRELGKKEGLLRTLGSQANILYSHGDLDGAMALYKEDEHFCRELGNKHLLSKSLGNQAVILNDQGDLDGAMALHKEEERLCRELGNVVGLARTLGNQAPILYSRGDLDGAMALFKEQEILCRELGDPKGLLISLANQARLLSGTPDREGEARRLADEALAIATRHGLQQLVPQIQRIRDYWEQGDRANLQAAALGNQAAILKARGDLDGAMALLKKQERFCRKLGDKEGLQAALGNQAAISIIEDRGDLGGAMALLEEQERLCRKLGNKEGLGASLGNQALILKARGDLDGAMALLEEQERLCRELGDKDGLPAALCNQALILKARGDPDGAMALLKEQERLCRELGDKDGLQAALYNQANILYAREDLDGAMALLKEQERLCRELGNKDGLLRALGSQANILSSRGDLDGAMALYNESERLCRELGNPRELSISLANQADTLERIPDRRAEARRLADEALVIATRHGYQELVPQIQRIRDSISSSEP
jgi:nephrocystin-3